MRRHQNLASHRDARLKTGLMGRLEVCLDSGVLDSGVLDSGVEEGVRPRIPVLFLFADTGGGHRNAARAVGEALEATYPGRFAPVLVDPLGGRHASVVLRAITRLYGPLIRHAPWLWGVLYRATDSRPVAALLQRSLFAPARRPVDEAMGAHRPAAVVSFHPLTTAAAVQALERRGDVIPVVTVVTDLITLHATWTYDRVERILLPPTAVHVGPRAHVAAPKHWAEIGLPVSSAFHSGPRGETARIRLRRSLGLDSRRFVVVMTGGGEGSGGMARRAEAIVEGIDDIDLVVLCGRNRRLEQRLRSLAARADGRLTVKGFVDDVADWFRTADVVVTKAGPGTIAEAACCGAALVVTSELPGQERGNVAFVVASGAARHAPGSADLVEVIDQLRGDPAALDAMRLASLGLSRPNAARDIAGELARLVGVGATSELAPRGAEAVGALHG